MFGILFVGTNLIQKFYVSVVFEVYAGLGKGSSIYMQVGFIKVTYAFWCMILEVVASYEWWCRFLGSTQCSSDNDLIVQIDWSLVDVVIIIEFDLQSFWWVQCENLMKRGLHSMLLCTRSIQFENLWNMVTWGY